MPINKLNCVNTALLFSVEGKVHKVDRGLSAV